MSDVHFSLWAIWPELSVLSKLFLSALALASTYVLFLASTTLSRLRSLSEQGFTAKSSAHPDSVATLQAMARNMRQLITAMFYLWGVVSFISLIGSNAPVEGEGTWPNMGLFMRVFLNFAAFAANVFLVLLILHSIQWVVSSRISKHIGSLNP